MMQLEITGMSAFEMDKTAAHSTQGISPLTAFFVKLAAITSVLLVSFYVVFSLVTGFIDEKIDQLAMLKGGPAFWGTAEDKLYKLAAAPDLPPEKKEKIVNALRTLSLRYKPYMDALAGDTKNPPQR
jgi:hypothetical protein